MSNWYRAQFVMIGLMTLMFVVGMCGLQQVAP